MVSLAMGASSAHATIEADNVSLADTIVFARIVSTEPAEATHAYSGDHPETRREVKLGKVVLEVLDTFKGDSAPKRIEVAMGERDLARTLKEFAPTNRSSELSVMSARKVGVGSTGVWYLQPVNKNGKFFLRTTGSRSETLRNGQPDSSALVCDTNGFSYAVTGLEDGLAPEPMSAFAPSAAGLPPYLRLLDLLAANAESGNDPLRHLQSLFFLSPVEEDVRFLKSRAVSSLVPAQTQETWVASRLRPMAAKAKTDLDRLNWAALLSQWGDAAGERDFVSLLGKVGPKGVVVGFPHVNDPNAFLILARSEDPEWSSAGFVALASRPGLDNQVIPIALASLGKSERRDAAIREWVSRRLNGKPTNTPSELKSSLISAQKTFAPVSPIKH